MAKRVFEGDLRLYKFEDGGCAAITEFEEDEPLVEGMFVLLQSWKEEPEGEKPVSRFRHSKTDEEQAAFMEYAVKNHPEIAQFTGKRIRITIETVEE